MRQIPMLFSGSMVRALLDGTKTETRRILKGANLKPEPHSISPDLGFHICRWRSGARLDVKDKVRPGNLIWVKEAHFAHGQWRASDQRTKTGKPRRYFARVAESEILFDMDPELVRPNDLNMVTGWFKRPSLFMEKADSRLTLRVTGFNIERLHDITEASAIAEGIEHDQDRSKGNVIGWRDYLSRGGKVGTARGSYASLWDSINGPGAWDQNPWVEVTKFEVIRNNIAAVAA